MDSIARAFGSTTAVEKTRKEQDSSQLGAGARRSGFFAGKQKPNTTIADGDAGDEPLSTDTDSGLTALAERSHDEVEKAARRCIDSLDLEASVDKGDAATPPTAEAVLDALDAFQRSANEAIERLAEGAENVNRMRLRKKENWMNMKMETLRTATKTKLKQKEVAMNAQFKRDMNSKIKELTEGGLGQQLHEALDEKVRLEGELKASTIKATTIEGTLSAVRGKLETTEKEATALRHNVQALEEEGETARKQVNLISETLKGSKEEIRKQREQISSLQQQLGDTSQQQALQADLEEARKARDEAEMVRLRQVEEAGAEIERLKAEVAEGKTGVGAAAGEANLLRTQLEDSQRALATVRDELDQAHEEIVQRDRATAALADAAVAKEAELLAMQQAKEAAMEEAKAAAQAEQASGELGALRAELANCKAAQAATQAKLDAREKEAGQLRKKAEQLESAAKAEKQAHADKLNASESESGALKEKLAQLESMLGGPALAAGSGDGDGDDPEAAAARAAAAAAAEEERRRREAALKAEREKLEEALKEALSSADKYRTKTMTLEERVYELLRRHRVAMEGLERTTDALHRTARAMDKQHLAMEHAGQHNREERKVLISTAISSLQHLRTHLLSTLGSVYDIHKARSANDALPVPSLHVDSVKASKLKASSSLPTIASPYSPQVRSAKVQQSEVAAPRLPMPGGGMPLGYPLKLLRPLPSQVTRGNHGGDAEPDSEAAAEEGAAAGGAASSPGGHDPSRPSPDAAREKEGAIPGLPLLGILRHTAAGFEREATTASGRAMGRADPLRTPSPTRKQPLPGSLYMEQIAAYNTSRRDAIRVLVAECKSDPLPGRVKPALLRKWADEEALLSDAELAAKSPTGSLNQLKHKRVEGERATRAASRAREQAVAAAGKAAKVHEELHTQPELLPLPPTAKRSSPRATPHKPGSQ